MNNAIKHMIAQHGLVSSMARSHDKRGWVLPFLSHLPNPHYYLSLTNKICLLVKQSRGDSFAVSETRFARF